MKTKIELNGWVIDYHTKVVGKADPTEMQFWTISKGSQYIDIEEFQNLVKVGIASSMQSGEEGRFSYILSNPKDLKALNLKLDAVTGFTFSEMGDYIQKKLDKEAEEDPFGGRDPFYGHESVVQNAIDGLVEGDDFGPGPHPTAAFEPIAPATPSAFEKQVEQEITKLAQAIEKAIDVQVEIVGDRIDVYGYFYSIEGDEDTGRIEISNFDEELIAKYRPGSDMGRNRAVQIILGDFEDARSIEDGPSDHEFGGSIDVETGDKVDAGVYGKLWITGTGVVGDLWTSEDRDDIESGRGRGLRYSYVQAVQKGGRGPWIKVAYDRDAEVYEVVR